MNKTIQGALIAGLLISAGYFVQGSYKLVRIDRVNNELVVPMTSTLNSKSKLVTDNSHIHQKEVNFPLDEEKTFQTSNQESIPDFKLSKLSQKESLFEKIDGLDNNQIAALHATISELTQLQPKKRFASEAVDPVWSLKKQSDLEYTFYQQAAFLDKGVLDFIQCKTTVCRVAIELNEGSSLEASDILGWQNPSQIIYSNASNRTQKKRVDIYLELRDKL